MKILVICQFYYPENFVVTNIAEQLVKCGHDVDVLTGKPNYGYNHILPEYIHIKEQVINGVNVHRVNLCARKKTRFSIIKNYLSFWKNSKKWVRHCKTEYDVVYSMSLSPVTICCAGNLYKKKHHVKHIIHCVDLWPESVLVTKAVRKSSLAYKLLYKWSRSIYKKADKILIGSPSFAEYFEKVLKLPTTNLEFVPQCALVTNTDVTPYKYQEGTNILFCGNLGLIQLIDLIPETMKLLKDKKIYFHVIGMGPLTDKLIKDIENSGLREHIIYYGPMPASRAASYFKSADAIYVSLKDEGVVGKTIPNKLMMALAFGKPIIGVLKGDGRKILNEAGGAVLADENPESIKDAILAIDNMSEAAKAQFGKMNSQYYQSHFSVEEVTNKIIESLK